MPGAGHLFRAMLSVAAAFVLVVGGSLWLSEHYPALVANSGAFAAGVAFAIAFVAFAIARMLGVPGGTWTERSRRSVSAAHTSIPTAPECEHPSAQQRKNYADSGSMTM